MATSFLHFKNDTSDDDDFPYSSKQIDGCDAKPTHLQALIEDAEFLNGIQNKLLSITPSLQDTSDSEQDQEENAYEQALPKPKKFMCNRRAEVESVLALKYPGTLVTFLPESFSRSQENKSFVTRENCIIAWTVKVNGVILADLVSDNTQLRQIFLRSLSNEHDDGECSGWSVLEEHPGVSRPTWSPIPDTDVTLRQLLTGLHFVEYPAFRSKTTSAESQSIHR